MSNFSPTWHFFKKNHFFPKSILFSPKNLETIFPLYQSLLSLPQSPSLSSGAHPLSSGEFFGHRRLSVRRSPSHNHHLSPSALTLSPPTSSWATSEAIPPSFPVFLTPAQGVLSTVSLSPAKLLSLS